MNPLSDGNRLAKAGGLVLTCLTVAALLPGTDAAAAPPTGDRIYYTNQRTFLIPFTPEPGSSAIQLVLLHVSDDLGKTYKLHASSGPTEEKFKFDAPGDGWYWFAVQTKDSAGRFFPPNLYAVPPGLKVCVDTLPPAVYLKQVPTTDGSVAIEWKIVEDNPNLFTLRADYRPVGGKDWLPLQIPPRLEEKHFPWTPAVKGPWEVRMQIRDKANNLGEQTTNVTAGAWRDTSATPPPPDPARANIVRVNSKQIQLNYKVENVGKSDVSTVEIWYTENEGKTWSKFPKAAQREGPYVVSVTREGVYGFFVVPVSGVGLSDPPVAGTPPQVWVEVDLTNPVVTILGPPVVGTGADINKVTIRYQATDRNFGQSPIRIFWKPHSTTQNPNPEWAEVANNLPNEGVYVWTVPESVPAQFHLKVEAVDLAGNVGNDVTKEVVKVDPIKPKATIIGVEGVKAAPPPP
jgi:hypothetical protein